MMKPLIIFLVSLIFPAIISGQIQKRAISLINEGFCGSSIHFTSDSVAFYLTGCEGTQLFTKLNYKVSPDGEIKFKIVPYATYQPIIGFEKGTVVFDSYDSLFELPQLVFLTPDSKITESGWEVTGEPVGQNKGRMFYNIPDEFFKDSSINIRFHELDNLKDSLPAISKNDFTGNGPVYIIRIDTPPGFNTYTYMHYRPDLCDLSKLKFKLVNKKLHIWKEGKWSMVRG